MTSTQTLADKALATLNSYVESDDGAGIWNDVIYGLDYDGDALDQLEAEGIGGSDMVPFTDGSLARWVQSEQRWVSEPDWRPFWPTPSEDA